MDHVAQHDRVDRLAVEAAAPQGFADGDRAELGGRRVLQGSVERTDRCPDGVADDDFACAHDAFLDRVASCADESVANEGAPRHSRRRFDCAVTPAGTPARCNAAASDDGITCRSVRERYLCICILSTGALRRRLRGGIRHRGEGRTTMRTSRPAVGFRSRVLMVFALIAVAFGCAGGLGRESGQRVVLGDFVLDAEFDHLDIIEIMSN